MSPTPSFFHPNYSPPTKQFTEGSFFKGHGSMRRPFTQQNQFIDDGITFLEGKYDILTVKNTKTRFQQLLGPHGSKIWIMGILSIQELYPG